MRKQNSPRWFIAFLLICLLLLGAAGCACATETQNLLRQEHPEWAAPIMLEGAPNLHKVSDKLYRGAQPTAEGMQGLKALGIKTIVNLRSLHSDRDEIGDLDLNYEHIRMVAVAAEEEHVIRFLQIVTDPERTPVFVHCLHGADRTGVLSASYRILVQGWTKEAAILEMTEGGFGYHSIFSNLIEFLENLDIERIRQSIEAEKPLSGSP
jgi:protein tyrosine phosphatase (PTP) superfamily phosphohydrolase (DUF442 family)